jgi:hypothetical protein
MIYLFLLVGMITFALTKQEMKMNISEIIISIILRIRLQQVGGSVEVCL